MPSLALTVVIPAFNAERTITRSLDSVLTQTHTPTEVIVVDDGSTDDTARVVFNYLSRHNLSRWRLLSQANSGPASARDAAIRAATGSHIALLDADDAWLPEKLAVSLTHIAEQRLDLVGARLQTDRSDKACRLISARRMMFRNPYFTSTVVLSRAAYLDVGGFDLTQRYSEDYKLWLAFAWRGKRCGQIDRALATYRVDAHGPHRGLSSHLWSMQRSELANFRWLRSSGLAPARWCVLAQGVSWLKFVRRALQNQ